MVTKNNPPQEVVSRKSVERAVLAHRKRKAEQAKQRKAPKRRHKIGIFAPTEAQQHNLELIRLARADGIAEGRRLAETAFRESSDKSRLARFVAEVDDMVHNGLADDDCLSGVFTSPKGGRQVAHAITLGTLRAAADKVRPAVTTIVARFAYDVKDVWKSVYNEAANQWAADKAEAK